MYVVVARWSNDVFVIFINFRHLCTTVDDYSSVEFSQKKKFMSLPLEEKFVKVTCLVLPFICRSYES
jgi:hypothetical protein